MNIPLFDFAAANPWLTAWCIWPIAMALCCFAWLFAEGVTNGMNLILRLATLAANAFVISLRGYAPQSAEANPEDGADKDET